MSDIPAQPAPQDPMWDDFQRVEATQAEELERQYREIEEINSRFINQIVGLESPSYTPVAGLSEGAINPPDLSQSRTNMVRLYLRPDRRDELFEQGETGPALHRDGDPHTIYGEVPARSQKLIDDLMASLEAVKNEAESTPTHEIWVGNVGGAPIEIVKRHQVYRRVLLDSEKSEPALSITAYRPGARKNMFT